MVNFKGGTTALALLLFLNSIAQEKSKRLYIGDKVPDIEIKKLYNYPRKSARLSDFKGKAVVLDFWSKDCSSCIAGFPNLQKIQEEFRDDLVILLVNDEVDETREALEPLFKRSPILKSTTLPMIMGDEIFDNKGELFPHRGVPYHVWIDKNGVIQATTTATEATRENLQKLVKGEKLDVVRRVDILEERDRKTSWISYNNGQFINNLLYYRSAGLTYNRNDRNIELSPLTDLELGEQYHALLMKDPHAGNLAGSASPFSILYDKNEKQIGRWDLGSFLHLYSIAYATLGFPVFVDGDENLNLKDNFIYEYTHPEFTDYGDSLFFETFKHDLSQYFGYTGTVEVRNVECYILCRTDKALKLKSEQGQPIYEDTKSGRGTVIQNQRFGILASHLVGTIPADSFGNEALVFDETHVDQKTKIDMTIPGLQSAAKLNLELSKYGLGIKKDWRPQPVLILRRVKQ